MDFLSIARVALRSLQRTPLRSSLTALGIVIGVAAVIAMVAIGSGAKARVERSLATLRPTHLTLVALPPDTAAGPQKSRPMSGAPGLTPADYRAIREEITGIVRMSPVVHAQSGVAQTRGRSSEVTITGIDVEGLELQARRLISGAGFVASDVSRAASVCVLTQSLASALFQRDDALGSIVRLNGQPFRVVGVVATSVPAASEQPLQAQILDAAAFIPYTSLLLRIDRAGEMAIAIEGTRPEQVPDLKLALLDLMESRRGSRKVDFKVATADEAIHFYSDGAKTMALLLAAIAGVALVVGGIGIMNIMLVSVTERTKEIGIRLAIGTRSRDVLRQFLVEALTLSVLGGIVGIAVGLGIAGVIARLNGWPLRVTLTAVFGAFVCSASIGIFFGYYPARRAALMDPVEALRAE